MLPPHAGQEPADKTENAVTLRQPVQPSPPMPLGTRPRVLIVTPATASANNGNWQTAQRWAAFLKGGFDVDVAQHWDQRPRDVMLALHARRSAADAAAWAASKGITRAAPGLGLVLTGTDLYRDIQIDTMAQQSLELAQSLTVLQEKGVDHLPPQHRKKTRVIYQSTPTRRLLTKTSRHLRVLMVGHLRDEKSPQTLFEAARLLSPDSGILIDHIGAPLDESLGAQARLTAESCLHYRWLGGLGHEATRRHIQRAHLLVHASTMEGGAHVIMEAVCSGTPVLASNVDGNVGMLGGLYSGYFGVGNAQSLVALLRKIREEQTGGPDKDGHPLMAHLTTQCAQRAPLFAPQAEKQALINWVNDLLPKKTADTP